MWNSCISFMNESYIVLAVSCFVNYYVSDWSSWGGYVDNIIALITGITILVLPIFYFSLLRQNKNKINDPDFMTKYIEIYEALNKEKSVKRASILFEPSITKLRILILVAALIFLQKYLFF